MIKLKSLLEGYLWDSESPLIRILLKEIQPLMDDIIATYERKANEKGRDFTKFDRELVEATLRFDLLKSLGSYTKPTDKIISKQISKSHKGALTIDAVIERDGEKYPFHTEVIYAGGHTIQVLHFRYLTHTTLPKVNSNPEADRAKAELQRLSKGEKIKKEIELNAERISNFERSIDGLKNQTDDDTLAADRLWNDDGYSKLDWDEIVRRRADKNYGYDKKKFDDSKEEYRQSVLVRRAERIKQFTNTITGLKQNITKLQSKLDGLVR